MPRGGERAGKVGGTYENRSDMQRGPRTAGQNTAQYGAGKKAAAVQATPDAEEFVLKPGDLTSMTAPTQRPEEPVTSGLPIGPGAGPEALTAAPVYDDALFDLRAVAAKYGYKDFLRIITAAEQEK